jgi:hypothetical protein
MLSFFQDTLYLNLLCMTMINRTFGNSAIYGQSHSDERGLPLGQSCCVEPGLHQFVLVEGALLYK